MNRHALVVGKFYPPHAGHKYLIQQAEENSTRVTVALLANSSETIPVDVRHAWLEEVHPSVNVVSAIADHPVDYKDPVVWDLWEKEIRGLCPDQIDAVYTSEPYGDELARRFSAKHFLVDREREVFPVSGTAVRADPEAHWNYLEPCVRSWFAKRICVLGAESTGTSTLAMALAEHYGTEYVPEYGRQYSDERVTWAPQWEWRTEHFVEIARGQIELEEAAARRSPPLLICDTDPLATSVWHERYMGTPSPELVAIAASRHYALYILTGAEIPWVQDGTRDGKDMREWMNERFREALASRPETFVEVAGSHEERLAAATAAVDGVLAGKVGHTSRTGGGHTSRTGGGA
jgi:NadR type nicotinamide-nucleotide adenylyltransferase